MSTPGRILTDEEDFAHHHYDYNHITIPANWRWIITKSRSQGDKIREAWNSVFEPLDGMNWYGLIGDDCVPITEHWDTELVSKCGPWDIVSCDDSWQAPKRLGNCWVMGGDIARIVGGIFPGKLQHLFVDDVWETVGRDADCWECRMAVVVRHVHVLKGEAPTDETHRSVYGDNGDRSGGQWPQDSEEFGRWLVEDRARIVATVRREREAIGLTRKATTSAQSKSLRGIWLLPTSKRPEGLKAFFKACAATMMQTGGIVIVGNDELETYASGENAVTLPPHWNWWSSEAEGPAAQCEEVIQGLGKTDIGALDWIGILADDLAPEQPFWDQALVTRIAGNNIVCANDGHAAPKEVKSAVVFSVPLLKEVGYFVPQGIQGKRWRDLWQMLGRDTGCITWALDVTVKERKRADTRALDAGEAQSFPDDEKAFHAWRVDGRKAAGEAVFRLVERSGQKLVKLRFEGKSFMIAVPNASGKYDAEFLRSLRETECVIEELGGKTELAELAFCSEVDLARAQLFSHFLRSEHTHLVFIDDDMGWTPQDFLRLNEFDLDFVGAAGPKKKYPLEFAFESVTADNQPKPIVATHDGLVFEVSGVGMAFVMISRGCAEKIAAAYPEQDFMTDNGMVVHGVFAPMIVNRRRLPEDYSFCRRWTAIGGKVHMLPHIRLKHVGSFVFEGCLMDEIMARAARQQVA